MTVTPLPDPWANSDSTAQQQPQPFTGGSNIAPMPAQSKSGGNPFTDVLNHVDAFNTALSGGGPSPSPWQATPLSSVNPMANTQPGDGFDKGGIGDAPNNGGTNGGGGTQPVSDPRTRPSAPPAAYSDVNPPPKPSDEDMRDPEKAAAYYRLFNFKNPAFASISGADVTNQRMLAVSGQFAAMGHPEWQDIGTWVLAGKPGGQYQPATGGTPAPDGGPVPDGGYPAPALGDEWRQFAPAPYQGYWNPGGTQPPPASGAPPSVAPPAGTTPPPGTPPPPASTAPPAPPAGTTPPPAGSGAPPPDIQSLIDMFQKEAGANNGPDIESLLNPMFARQRQVVSDQMRAEAALTPGRLESGGFGENEGDALATLSGQQSGKMADALQAQHLAKMQQNTQLIQLGTQAGMQKYVADLNADLTKFQVNSNADLQKWLDSADNVLKKYGIDTNDVLQRYQSELQLKGQMYSADKGVDAAALQASAAHAAAAAASAASQANAKLQYDLGMQGLNVDREKNIGNFILGLLGVGNMDLNTINGILNGIVPGTVIAKP